jgi:hypothetical protein
VRLQALAPTVPPGTDLRRRWALHSAAALTRVGDPRAALRLLRDEEALDGGAESQSMLFEAAVAAGDWALVAGQLRKALPALPQEGGPTLTSEEVEPVLGVIAAELNAGRSDEALSLAASWAPYLAGRPEARILALLLQERIS